MSMDIIEEALSWLATHPNIGENGERLIRALAEELLAERLNRKNSEFADRFAAERAGLEHRVIPVEAYKLVGKEKP